MRRRNSCRRRPRFSSNQLVAGRLETGIRCDPKKCDAHLRSQVRFYGSQKEMACELLPYITPRPVLLR